MLFGLKVDRAIMLLFHRNGAVVYPLKLCRLDLKPLFVEYSKQNISVKLILLVLQNVHEKYQG